MTPVSSIKVAAVFENLPAAAACALTAARGAGLDERLGDVELIVEEFFTNVCKYAGPAGTVELELSCLADETEFVVELRDSGSPFDPVARPDPDVHAPLEERSAGGLGVFLAKKLSDGVEYRREGALNVVRVRFLRSKRP